jgi:hypothetical protein
MVQRSQTVLRALYIRHKLLRGLAQMLAKQELVTMEFLPAQQIMFSTLVKMVAVTSATTAL